MQCTFFEGGVRRFVVKGSRAYLRATDIYIYIGIIMYIVAVYIVWVPTVIPLELNKLSLFGTKMVTLFGRWNKRLLLAKVLVGTNRYGAVNYLNYKQFLVVCAVLLFLYLVSSSPVKHVCCVCMHQGFDNCLFRAVWSKPVWEISPTHRPT